MVISSIVVYSKQLRDLNICGNVNVVNVIELHACISYMKDKSGINGWRDEQNLLKVNLTYCNLTNLCCK